MPTTFTNQATLSYNNQTFPSNVVTGVLNEVLTADKRVVSGSYRSGDTMTYAISVVNSGATPITGLTVTDNLGAYAPTAGGATVVPMTYIPDTVFLYTNGVAQAAPTVSAENPLTITGITVPAGGNVVLLYSAQANQYAPLGTVGTINNTATITGGGLATPLVAAATAAADPAPALSVIKSMNPSTVVENEPLTYTFTIQNNGATATDATDAVVLTDTFNPPLNITRVALNGTDITQGTGYTYAGGVFTTVTPITVPAATYTTDPATGLVSVQPGVTTLTVTGTL